MKPSGSPCTERKARSRIRICVTAEHIKNGAPADPHHCPIAEALGEQFPRAKQIRVQTRWAFVGKAKYLMSSRASDFIYAFDSHIRRRNAQPSVFYFTRHQ